MNEFRKSYGNNDRGMTVRRNGTNQEMAIIENMLNGDNRTGTPATAATKTPTVEFVGEPTCEYETITPDIAAEYLKKNVKNRPIKERHLNKLIYTMKTGQFDHTAEPIKFDTDGNLVDGQHRLHAIVKSGVTLRLLVARGIPVSARGKLDGGKPRSIGDNFVIIEGVSNGNRTAAAVKMFYMLTTGKHPDLLTFDDCVDIRNKNRETFEWVARAFSNNTMFDNGVIAGAAAIAYQHDPERVDQFFSDLHTGLHLTDGSPVAALRNAIINIKTAGKSRNNFGSITDRYKFALKVLRAVSLYLDDKSIVGPSNLYATPLGLKYFIRNASIPNFMTQE